MAKAAVGSSAAIIMAALKSACTGVLYASSIRKCVAQMGAAAQMPANSNQHGRRGPWSSMARVKACRKVSAAAAVTNTANTANGYLNEAMTLGRTLIFLVLLWSAGLAGFRKYQKLIKATLSTPAR
ncbi:MAG TPA: hypothetical protein VG900_07075 [Hyphomicrobiaceae bacterium]|nr:hypothetical protein [Hyphomicrobiaceae bacterium]